MRFRDRFLDLRRHTFGVRYECGAMASVSAAQARRGAPRMIANYPPLMPPQPCTAPRRPAISTYPLPSTMLLPCRTPPIRIRLFPKGPLRLWVSALRCLGNHHHPATLATGLPTSGPMVVPPHQPRSCRRCLYSLLRRRLPHPLLPPPGSQGKGSHSLDAGTGSSASRAHAAWSMPPGAFCGPHQSPVKGVRYITH